MLALKTKSQWIDSSLMCQCQYGSDLEREKGVCAVFIYPRCELHFHLLSTIESLSVTQHSNLIIQKHQRKSKTKQKIISGDDIDI